MIRSAHFASRPARRPGTIIALMAVTIFGLVAFLALAIDLGMVAIAKTQAQNAADVAALTAARTLNGDSSSTYNNANASTNAKNILTYNYILGQSVQSSQLTLTFGSYDYNQTSQSFSANYPATTGVPYTATSATVVSSSLPSAFSSVFGKQFLPNVTATAQAVHRPRDICLVMDLSGSMRMGTCMGYDFYSSTRISNNPDTNVPTFGHYSSSSANMIAASSTRSSAYDNYSLPGANTTAGNSSYSLTYINGFYQNAAYASTLVRAFDSYTSTDSGTTWSAPSSGASPQLPSGTTYASTPGGDRPLYTSGSTTTYAKTISDFTGSTSRNARWELDGYATTTNGSFPATDPLSGQSDYSTKPFNGYTRGPGYYGKTFFIWPPDPRRPLNTGTATAWSSTATDIATIKGFLTTDFGYDSTNDYGNSSVTTTLSAAITNSATSFNVNSTNAAKFPVNPFTSFKIVIGSEVMTVTAVSGASKNTWTVTRAVDGSTAAAASNGATVGLMTGPPLQGIYTAASTSTSPGKTPSTAQTWPWASSSSLSTYLTTNVYIPGSQVTTTNQARRLATTDDAYQKIMRLYNWVNVIDTNWRNVSGTATPADWRIRFFGTDDNTVIFDSTGSLNPPGTSGMCTAAQTYTEILRWIVQTTDPFPTQLRSGRIKYYSSIPTTITGTYPNWGGTDQRFWVEFIDHVLGFRQTASGTYSDISPYAGYGDDFTWGTMARTSPPGNPAGATQYMSYSDNPLRPRLRHWFSPILMVDLLHSYNMAINVSNYFVMQPGNTYEAPLYTAREAYYAAIDTMKNDHPNDWFSLVAYSWPRTSATDTTGRLNGVLCPMGTNYDYAKSALFFPFSTIKADGTANNTEITPYDVDANTSLVPSANFVDTPRADGNTCFSMALMLCYNQFAVTTTTDTTLRSFTTSTPITFPTGMSGGLGRKGAQKVIIFETDGLPNQSATVSLTTPSGKSYSYYPIRYDMNRPYSSEYPSSSSYTINSSTVTTEINSLVDQLKTSYGTTRNPFRLYALGFGPVFTGPDATDAKTTLQTMQYHAGTQSSASTALPSNQIITGTDSQMSSNMVSAFTSILQNGVQIALIK